MNRTEVTVDGIFTVGELVEELKKVPADYEVFVNTQDGAFYQLSSFVVCPDTEDIELGS
jgi:hypothetical protein